MEENKTFLHKNILITGGAGFLGSSLAHALVARGAKVTVLDAMLPLYGGNLFNLEDIKDSVEFIQGDIRDEELIKKLVTGKDIIYNFAAQVSYIDSKDQPFLDLDINGKGHLNVIEAVRQFAPQARILFSSSRMVYGKILTTPVSESHPTDPLSLYGIHKLLAEKYYRYYTHTFGLDTVSVRIPNPYGPRQQMKHNKYSIVGWFVRQAMEGKPITIFGDGSQERDYLYVDDIVDAFLELTEHGVAGEVYNIGAEERVTFGDMVDAVLEEVGSGSKECIPWPENYEKNETGNYIADTSKIEQITSWKPSVTLKEGIARMVEYYKKNKAHYW
ncbi:MAG: SDR family NAD(P)-dependent oxidoreductase [Candidatus Andersenbacteria bacterium]